MYLSGSFYLPWGQDYNGSCKLIPAQHLFKDQPILQYWEQKTDYFNLE